MTRPEGPAPTLSERVRMPLRIASVFLGYLLYLLVPGPVVARILLWVGLIGVGWAVIEQLTTYRRQRLSILIVGQACLGIGLVAAAVIMLLR